MKPKWKQWQGLRPLIALMAMLMCMPMGASADDTDIYQPKVKHNVIILYDSSGSMGFGVYDNDVDYHAFYQYICDTYGSDAHDAIAGGYGTSAYFYPDWRAEERTKIYLIYGNIGYANGLTGDPADPSYLWYISSLVDTGTYLTAAGELEDANGNNPGDAGYAGRVGTTVDSTTNETMVTLDGQQLPNGKDIAMYDWQQNPDGSRVNNGFVGMVRAPGYYFSGYFYKSSGGDKNDPVTDSSSSYTDDPAQAGTYDGKEKDYFFITGNWINMQMVYNLEVEVSNNNWQPAWENVDFPAQN
jgi:type IV pilus assembly protein PilY1